MHGASNSGSRAVRDFVVDDRLRDRLMGRVVVGANGCWEWQGTQDGGGYGRIRVTTAGGQSRRVQAHRVSYLLHVGSIPDGLILDHLCRNRTCVNPAHLEPVTDHVNIMRGNSRMAINAAKTHCNEGHPFSGDNLYIKPGRGERVCRTCKRADDLARLRRRRTTRMSP